MNVFCKLNRITFHFFNFTLSLSSKQLAVLLLRCSPTHSICQQHHILPSNSTSAPPCRSFFSYAHISFARCVRPYFITNPRYLNTQLSRFLHKSIPYMTRAYARERKTITFPHHGLHRTKANTLPHSPIRTNAIRARFGPLPRLAKETNLRKQVGQQPGIKRTTPTNHPAPIDP